MKLLLYSGLLYLIGIAIVLYLRPTIMFAADGTWKEFGIGRDPEYYTWMPFWLFAVSWAVIAYILILVLASANILPGVEVMNEFDMEDVTSNMSNKLRRKFLDANSSNLLTRVVTPDLEEVGADAESIIESLSKSAAKRPVAPKVTDELKPGYYILNAAETTRKGVPKYIYLGPEAPNLIFNKGIDTE